MNDNKIVVTLTDPTKAPVVEVETTGKEYYVTAAMAASAAQNAANYAEEQADRAEEAKDKTKDYYDFLVAKGHMTFNTVAEMKQQNLPIGCVVKTIGYYSVNDGGDAFYVVKDNTASYDGYINHKLSNGNVAELIIEDTINVLKVGMRGNKTQDNSPIMDILSTNYNKYCLYFPKGDYNFSRGMLFTNFMFLKLDRYAELNLVSSTVQEYFIKLTGNHSNYGVNYFWTEDNIGNAPQSYIDDGSINGRFNCKDLIQIGVVKSVDLHPAWMKNFKRYGCATVKDNYIGVDGTAQSAAGTVYAHDVEVMCNVTSANMLIAGSGNDVFEHYAFHEGDGSTDNKYWNIVIRDVYRGFYTKDAMVYNVHMWRSRDFLLPNSCVARIVNNGSQFHNIFMDTLHKGFIFNSYTHAIINGLRIFNNSTFYTDAQFTTYPNVIFDNSAGNVGIIASNVYFVTTHNMYFTSIADTTRYSRYSNIDIETTNGSAIYNKQALYEKCILTTSIDIGTTLQYKSNESRHTDIVIINKSSGASEFHLVTVTSNTSINDVKLGGTATANTTFSINNGVITVTATRYSFITIMSSGYIYRVDNEG